MSQGMDVNENSSMAEIGQAKLINGAMQLEAQVDETVALQEHSVLHAQETQAQTKGGPEGGQGLMSRASSSSASLNSAKAAGANRAGVYGDMAFEASGVGGLAQAGKMLCDAVREYKNPFAFGSAKTFDQIISEGASKPVLGGAKKAGAKSAGKKGNIFTGEYNEAAALQGRAKGVNDFMSSPLKGVKTSESKFAEFSKRRELNATCKMVNAQKLAVANKVELEVGAKIAKAKQVGLAPAALNMDRMKNGPKYVAPKDEVVEDSSTAWA